MAGTYRILHISDIHLWNFTWNPLLWLGKRGLGLANLALRRARKFRREEMPHLLLALEEDDADHLVVSGDLTTTSLPSEFDDFRRTFEGWLTGPERATVLPGNHDRYTQATYRKRVFDSLFGEYCGGGRLPFLKRLAEGLDLIGFDTSVPRPLSARGLVQAADVEKLTTLLAKVRENSAKTLLFVCHYPAEVPPEHAKHERGHELVDAHLLLEALSRFPIPVYWLHGHLHHPWRFASPTLSHVVYLNPGAPLLRRSEGVSLGRWLLDWDGKDLLTEWRSRPEAASYLSRKDGKDA